jgi:hypothetical protein
VNRVLQARHASFAIEEGIQPFPSRADIEALIAENMRLKAALRQQLVADNLRLKEMLGRFSE